MKSLKIKLAYTISMVMIIIVVSIIGVWAVGETQRINLSGNVNFTISDGTLYIKDIRIRNENDLTGQGTTINNFLPGFVNGSFDLNIGSVSADTSFCLLFDIINTTATSYEASTTSTIPNANISVKGTIAGDGVDPTTITDSTGISGTIIMTITAFSAGLIDLGGTEILLEPVEEIFYEVTLTGNALDAFIIGEEGNIELTNNIETIIQVPQSNNKLCVIKVIKGDINSGLIDWTNIGTLLIYEDIYSIGSYIEEVDEIIVYINEEIVVDQILNYPYPSQNVFTYYFICYIITINEACTVQVEI